MNFPGASRSVVPSGAVPWPEALMPRTACLAGPLLLAAASGPTLPECGHRKPPWQSRLRGPRVPDPIRVRSLRGTNSPWSQACRTVPAAAGSRPAPSYTWLSPPFQVIRLESQVSRYKSAAENAEKIEDELKAEKRKLQREVNSGTVSRERGHDLCPRSQRAQPDHANPPGKPARAAGSAPLLGAIRSGISLDPSMRILIPEAS